MGEAEGEVCIITRRHFDIVIVRTLALGRVRLRVLEIWNGVTSLYVAGVGLRNAFLDVADLLL